MYIVHTITILKTLPIHIPTLPLPPPAPTFRQDYQHYHSHTMQPQDPQSGVNLLGFQKSMCRKAAIALYILGPSTFCAGCLFLF